MLLLALLFASLGSIVGAGILIKAVAITNALIGGRKPTDMDYEFRDGSMIPRLKTKQGILIGDLSGPHAFALVIINFLLQLLIQLGVVVILVGFASLSNLTTKAGISKAGGQMASTFVILISIPFSLVVRWAVLTMGLETTAGKGFVVMIFDSLIWAGVLLAFFVGLVLGGVTVFSLSH